MIFLSTTCYSQETLNPEKTISFGLNSHTNRDEAFFSNIDSNKNTVLVGTTERDSTFTDILTTKLDVNYNLLWQKRYSVPTNLSYDLPLKSFINDNDDVYVIGRSSFSQSRSNGLIFIIKYDENGSVIYQKNIGNIDGSDYSDYSQMDAVLNNDGSLSLFYETDFYHVDSSNGERTSTFHLLKIDALGNIINSNNYEIPYREFKAKLYNNGLYLLIKNIVDENNQIFSFHLYKIQNNGNISSFEIVDEHFIDFMKYPIFSENVSLNYLNNNLYISSANNEGYNELKNKIYFSKFSLDGDIIYSIKSDSNKKYYYLGHFKKIDEGKIIYLANNLDNNILSSLTINENNEIIETEIVNNLGTGFKNNNDDSFFITLSNNIIKLFSKDLTEINSFTTSDTYNLIDFSKIDDNTITSFGIVFNKMFPDSDYYTQLDQFAEKINLNTVEKTYSFSGEGTSKAFQQVINIDNNNDYIILSAEKLGPECLNIGCNSPSFGNRIIKYDSNLNKLWELNLTDEVKNITSNYNYHNLVFDSNNNIYLNVADKDNVWWNRKYTLYKISPNGDIIFKTESTQSIKIVINEEDNKIYIISPQFSETNQTTWITSYWTELLSFNSNSGDLIDTTIYDDKEYYGYFINNNLFYIYLIEGNVYVDHNITLYKGNEIIFKRYLNISYSGSISTAPLIKEDGTLIFTSGSSSSDLDKKFHKINSINEYNSYQINSNLGKLIPIGNNILTYNEDNYFKIYNSSFQEIASSDLEYPNNSGFYYTVFSNKILLQFENKKIVFDEELNVIKEFKLPNLFDYNFKFDNNKDLIIVSNFGNSIYLYPQYSWLRGYLSKYNIETALNVGDFKNEINKIIVFPNPTNGFFKIEVNKAIFKKVIVYDINGKFIKESFFNNLNIQNFKNGIYLLKIFTNNGIINSKIIKN